MTYAGDDISNALQKSIVEQTKVVTTHKKYSDVPRYRVFHRSQIAQMKVAGLDFLIYKLREIQLFSKNNT